MYVQRSDEKFVLNPRGNSENSSYEFEDEQLRLYIENKKFLRRELTHYFGKSSQAEFLRKVGNYNVYDVKIVEPIKIHDDECYVTESPAYTEMLIFQITVDPLELTNSKKRSTLLKYFVLGHDLTSTNFIKDVEDRCVRIENNGLVTLLKKNSGTSIDQTIPTKIETQ